jgi:hypothetical protein
MQNLQEILKMPSFVPMIENIFNKQLKNWKRFIHFIRTLEPLL